MLPILLLWLSIVINEFVPAPSSGSEWVELYNAGSSSVDVSNWVIDDDTPGGTRVVIANGTIVPAGGYLVVAIPSAILNNSGDAVTLSDASGTTVDQIHYTSSTSNQAILRIPDGSSTIMSSASLSPGSANAPESSTATRAPETSTPTASTLPTLTASATEPVQTNTPTPYLTETVTGTVAPSNTATATITETPSKTPSPTKTETPSKTPSLTRTTSPTKTETPSKTPSPTKTETPSKTPTETKTDPPARTTTTKNLSSWAVTPTSHQWLKIAQHERTAVVIMCQHHAHTLEGWWLTIDGTAQELSTDQRCTSAEVPADAQISLANPHHYLVATVAVADALCASDIAFCRPTPSVAPPATPRLTLLQPAVVAVPPAPETTGVRNEPVDVVALDPVAPPSSRWPLLQVGALCVLAGLLGLRTLASAPTNVVYSEADADATSSAEPIAQRVEDGASSTNDQRERHR